METSLNCFGFFILVLIRTLYIVTIYIYFNYSGHRLCKELSDVRTQLPRFLFFKVGLIFGPFS